MAKKKKNEEDQLNRSQLSEVAAELNDALGLEPEIDTDAKIGQLKEKVSEAAAHVDPGEDELSEKTWAVLEKMGAAHRPAQEYTPQREDEPAVEEDEGGEDEKTDLVTKIQDTKKLNDLKEIVNNRSEFKELRKNLDNYTGIHGPKQLRIDMYNALGVEPPTPAYKRKKSEKKEKGPSAFGTAVEEMCKNPDQGKDALIKAVKKQGINTDAGKSAIQTAYTSVRKIVRLLRKNGYMD